MPDVTKQLMQLGAVGALVGAAYVAAKQGTLGPGAEKFAQQVANDWGAAFGRHPAAPGPNKAPPAQGPGPGGDPGSGTTQTQGPYGQSGAATDGSSQGQSNTTTGDTNLVPTTLTDLWGFPVVYDPTLGTLKQDPALNGTNTYTANDIFIDSRDGQQWQFNGGTTFTSMSSGEVAQLDQFSQS